MIMDFGPLSPRTVTAMGKKAGNTGWLRFSSMWTAPLLLLKSQLATVLLSLLPWNIEAVQREDMKGVLPMPLAECEALPPNIGQSEMLARPVGFWNLSKICFASDRESVWPPVP